MTGFILWVKWRTAWPASYQGEWEHAGQDHEPDGWLLERLEEIKGSILEWEITEDTSEIREARELPSWFLFPRPQR